MLKESFLKQYIGKIPPFGPLGYITYKRILARLIPDLNRTEEWRETCERVCNGIVELGGKFTEEELNQLFDNMFNLKGLPASRVIWQSGTDTVCKFGASSLNSCFGLTVNSLEAFTFAFNQTLLDNGIGYNIRAPFIYELPRVKNVTVKQIESYDVDFIVPDSRQGWVELLRKILDAFFVTGQDFTYSTLCVRPAGRLLKTFGGYSSGAENLNNGMNKVIKIIKAREGKKLRSIDCLDLLNVLGYINFKRNGRSAQLALGDVTDIDFVNAKDWTHGIVPNWRAMANLSVSMDDYSKIPDDFWNKADIPGLVNLRNLRRFGRLIDGVDYRPDYGVDAVNACSELGLENGESCNLADIVLSRISSLEEFKQVATLLYKVCKTISCAKYSDPLTQKVVEKNHRIGLSLTGIMQSHFTVEDFNTVYKHLETVDESYSREIGVGKSIKLTCVKPSGTISLLPGVTPGIHPAFANYMIQRIRFNSNDPLVEVCQKHGYYVEPHVGFDGSKDSNMLVVEFPIKMSGPTKLSVIEQLENQKKLQTFWADNAISATHYLKDSELPQVKEWLKNNYNESVKSCIFLRTDNKVYPQAPYEEISKEEYEKRKRPPITNINDTEQIDMIDSFECGKGGCPLK